MTEFQEIEFIDEIEEPVKDLTIFSYIKNNICVEYFIGSEVATLIGYKNTSDVILKKVSRSNKINFRDYNGLKIPALNPKTILITRYGICELLSSSRKKLTEISTSIFKKLKIKHEKLYDNNDVNSYINNEVLNKLKVEFRKEIMCELMTEGKLKEEVKEEVKDNDSTDSDEEITSILTTFSHICNNTTIEYFIGREVILALGYKNTKRIIKKYVTKENKISFKDFTGEKSKNLQPHVILITKEGITEILSEPKLAKITLSRDTLNMFKKHNIDIPDKFLPKKNIIEEIETDDEEDERELTTYTYISNQLYFEYFVGYEIVSLIGYKNPARVISNNVSKSNTLEFRDYPGVKIPELDPRTILITRDGAIEILIKTRKRITPDVLHILKKFNIDTTNRKCLTKEQQTLSAIANVFKTERIEDQFHIDEYYLDMYFPEYKIVVECDENGHFDRKPYDERFRMDIVNETLNIDDSNWIRYNPDEKDFDISKVIGQIYMKIMEIKDKKYEDIELEDESDDEEEMQKIEDDTRSELEKVNFKGIRKICKSLEVIQLGNKVDLVNRLVKHKQEQRRKEKQEFKEFEKKQKETLIKYIYQYNKKGILVNKYKSIEEASRKTKIDSIQIEDCINENIYKVGGCIWRDKETTFTKDELKKLTRSNAVIVVKMDESGNEIKRYDTIKEASEDTKLSRNILDRLLQSGKARDGFIYKSINFDNRMKHMTANDREEIIRKRNSGVSASDLAIEYNKCAKYIRSIVLENTRQQ